MSLRGTRTTVWEPMIYDYVLNAGFSLIYHWVWKWNMVECKSYGVQIKFFNDTTIQNPYQTYKIEFNWGRILKEINHEFCINADFITEMISIETM